MHHFAYRSGVMHAEDVSLTAIAEKVGTPFYCYSEATIRRHMRVFRAAFAGVDALTAYSVKANSNLAVLRIIAEEGGGADVVSAGELKRARRAGVKGSMIVFSGVGKTREEMAIALDEGVLQFNVESENELLALDEVARSKGVRAPVALRINPDVSAGGHEKISTGKAEDKFGIPWTRARDTYRTAHGLQGIEICGVDFHIGSQIASLDPFERAFSRVADLVAALRDDGMSIKRIDLGGGLGISYSNADPAPPHPDQYAELIKRIAAPLGVSLVFEPGRMIVGNAGVLVARALYDKRGDARRFLIVDAAMNDLLRPALYDAFHDIKPVAEPASDAEIAAYDVVGPVCETGDRFAARREMPVVEEDALVAFMSAGAYGATLSSQYNSRPLVPEVLVSGEKWRVIRRRPDFEDMIALEV